MRGGAGIPGVVTPSVIVPASDWLVGHNSGLWLVMALPRLPRTGHMLCFMLNTAFKWETLIWGHCSLLRKFNGIYQLWARIYYYKPYSHRIKKENVLHPPCWFWFILPLVSSPDQNVSVAHIVVQREMIPITSSHVSVLTWLSCLFFLMFRFHFIRKQYYAKQI